MGSLIINLTNASNQSDQLGNVLLMIYYSCHLIIKGTVLL